MAGYPFITAKQALWPGIDGLNCCLGCNSGPVHFYDRIKLLMIHNVFVHNL